MAQPLPDDLGRHAEVAEHVGGRVTQPVETEPVKAGPARGRPIHSVAEVPFEAKTVGCSLGKAFGVTEFYYLTDVNGYKSKPAAAATAKSTVVGSASWFGRARVKLIPSLGTSPAPSWMRTPVSLVLDPKEAESWQT